MSERNVEIIENAWLDDVRPGDHLTWDESRTLDGVTITNRREGIAGRRYGDDDWYTEEGMWITDGEFEGVTLTIRRPITKEN